MHKSYLDECCIWTIRVACFLIGFLWLTSHKAVAAADQTPGCGGSGQAACSFAKATLHGKATLVCNSGEFFDLRNGGECWKCPSGYDRTPLPVTDDNACVKSPSISYKSASKKKKIQFGKICDKGQFWDIRGGNGVLGACYTCPGGYVRTPFSVSGGKACAKPTGKGAAKASYVAKIKIACPVGQFFDPDDGGKCWSCPTGYIPSLVPATEPEACVIAPTNICDAGNYMTTEGRCVPQGQCGKEGERACMVWERIPTCDKGLIQNFSGDGSCIKMTAAVKQQICRETIENLNKGLRLTFMDQAVELVQKEIAKRQAYLNGLGKDNPVFREAEGFVSEEMGESLTEFKRIYEIAGKSDGLGKLFRSADLICSGDGKKINDYLESAGLKPKLPALAAKKPAQTVATTACPAQGRFFMEYRQQFKLNVVPGVGQGTAAFSLFTNYDDAVVIAFSVAGGGGLAAGIGMAGPAIIFYPQAYAGDFGVAHLGMSLAFSIPGLGLELPMLENWEVYGGGPSVLIGPQTLSGTINAVYNWPLLNMTKTAGGTWVSE